MAAASSQSSPIECLSTDILSQILVRLPNIKCLLRAKLVCKSWFTLISSSEFTHLYNLRHNNNSLLVYVRDDFNFQGRYLYGVEVNDDDVSKGEKIQLPPYLNKLGIIEVVASCHDLLLCIFGYSTLILLNPLTRLYHIIPGIKRGIDGKDSIIDRLLFPNSYPEDDYSIIGLGYDHIKDDYKVVIYESGAFGHIQVFLYSLRDGSWERESYFPDSFLISSYIKPAVCLLHFIHQHKRIVRFNVCNGEWSEIPAPGVESYINDIGVLNGCLSVLEGGIKLWVMKEYAVKKSWVLLLSVSDLYPIKFSLACTPLVISSDKNEILLHLKDDDQWMVSCVWYNLKEKKTRKAQISLWDNYVSLKSTFPVTDISKFNKKNKINWRW